MLYRYCISIVLVAITFSGAHAERVLTRVIDVEQSGAHEVVLDAGRLDGLREGARVTLLREGEAIVHPLTGEILGIPQEPVGLAEVKGLQDRRARTVMVKSYSRPQIGDLAEYGKVPMEAAATQPAPAEVAKVIKRVKTLEAGMQQYKKFQKSLSAYPVFAQQVWDEMGTIKSYLVALDERLIELETQQHEDRNRLTAMIGGESQGRGKELTIRYSEDTDLKLRVAGKTLMISVEPDSIRLKEVGVGETQEMPFTEDGLYLDGEEVAEEGEEGWDLSLDGMMAESPYILAGSLLFIAIIAGGLLVVIKRRYDYVMGGLDEYDQDFLADDDEDVEDFEDDSGKK